MANKGEPQRIKEPLDQHGISNVERLKEVYQLGWEVIARRYGIKSGTTMKGWYERSVRHCSQQ